MMAAAQLLGADDLAYGGMQADCYATEGAGPSDQLLDAVGVGADDDDVAGGARRAKRSRAGAGAAASAGDMGYTQHGEHGYMHADGGDGGGAAGGADAAGGAAAAPGSGAGAADDPAAASQLQTRHPLTLQVASNIAHLNEVVCQINDQLNSMEESVLDHLKHMQDLWHRKIEEVRARISEHRDSVAQQLAELSDETREAERRRQMLDAAASSLRTHFEACVGALMFGGGGGGGNVNGAGGGGGY